MNITTVGDLLDTLSDLPRSTPVLKSDPTGIGYYDLHLIGRACFTVIQAVPDGAKAGFPYYRDADGNEAAGFNAVVL